jgi:carotenoid 1,2-hydratase
VTRRPAGVPSGGYHWWYFDALSQDGERALTAIFFIGSVFSPSYALRLRRGEPARPEEHVAVNLALYERGRQVAWVMSEYGAGDLGEGGEAGPRIGQSAIERDGAGLRVTLRERSAPFFASLAGRWAGAPVEGTVQLEPLADGFAPVELACADGKRHGWQVVMPRARVRVRFARPDFNFDGVGYHDVNHGEGRLEDAFAKWSWARFHTGERTVVLYAAEERCGRRRALVVDGDGQARDVAPAGEGEPRRVGWGLSLPAWFALPSATGTLRCAPTQMVEVAPFYARYLGTLTDGAGPVVTGLGEHLDLDRFRDRGVQFLLRFKTRRVS